MPSECSLKMKRYLLGCLLVLVVNGVFARAATWFVATTGSDSNSCTSSGSPCLTIAHAESLSSSGDTISMAAGTYRLSTANNSTAGQLVPKANQTFTGPACTPVTGPTQCAAIVSGGISIGGLATGPDGNGNWSVTGQTQQGATFGRGCDTGWAGCNYPEDVFYDGVPLQHVFSATLPTLTTGQFWFDYTNHIIYFHQTPSGHTVETSVLNTMFTSNGVNGLTIQNLTIEEFANQLQAAAVAPAYGAAPTSGSGANWTVQNCYFTLNHGAGLATTFGMQVLNNVFTVNGQLGINGSAPPGAGITPSGLVVQGNLVTLNNYAHVDPGFGAGGAKWGNTANAIVRGNTVQNNIGNGIHFDTNSVNPLIDGNTISGNVDSAATDGSGLGISFEISELGATVRNNSVTFVGTNGSFGILSSTSGGMQAYCNVITEAAGVTNLAWAVVAGSRGNNLNQPNLGAQIVSIQNYFHHNTVIWNTGTGKVGYELFDTARQPNFFANNTPPDFNMYHAPTTGVVQFVYDNNGSGSNTAKTFANYQAAGADTHGTIDTVNTSGFPTVTITSPADQSSFSGTPSISATASDAGSITTASLYVDWTLAQTISGAGPFTFTMPAVAQGPHTVAVMATAASGVKSCNAVTLTQNTSTSVAPSNILAKVR
jgi:hypothetical protein